MQKDCDAWCDARDVKEFIQSHYALKRWAGTSQLKMNTYILAKQRDIRTSFWELLRRRTIPRVLLHVSLQRRLVPYQNDSISYKVHMLRETVGFDLASGPWWHQNLGLMKFMHALPTERTKWVVVLRLQDIVARISPQDEILVLDQVNLHWYNSLQYGISSWYHVNQYRATRENQGEQKSPQYRVNTPLARWIRSTYLILLV